MSLSGSAAEGRSPFGSSIPMTFRGEADFERTDFNKTGDAALHYDEPQGPDPTPENPGGVFPQSTSQAANSGTVPGSGPPQHGGDVRGVFGNIGMFQQTFRTLSSAFTTAINAVNDESGSGIGSVGKALIGKLESMRDEIDALRAGKGLPEAGGGEKNDQVDRAKGDGGGLYAS